MVTDGLRVQVPCAVDSGACANVAPANVFCLENAALANLEPEYFGADGSPIVNLGSHAAEGLADDGVELNRDFELAKITRPLPSMLKTTAAGRKVTFNEHGGSTIIKGTNRRMPLRQEGRLLMLDL